MNAQFISVIILLQTFHFALGLKCYKCSLTIPEGSEDTDMTCVNDPSSVEGRPVQTCPASMQFCVIIRNDIKATGAVRDIFRGCSSTPVVRNEDIESDVLIGHYRDCTTDLCNKGKGNEEPGFGDGDGGGINGGMVVPGKSHASINAANTKISLILCFIILLIRA